METKPMRAVSITHRGGSSVFNAFVRFNQKVSRAITPLPVRETSVFSMYVKIASIVLMQPESKRVLDAGAGAAWSFPLVYKKRFDLHIIGVDIDASEMVSNPSLDERIVTDICHNIPIDRESIDVVTAHSGVEHFPNNEAFLQNCFRVLRPGGRLIAQFPSRYAPFVLLNRALPHGMSRFLLKHFRPDAYDKLGFPAHYDRTNFSAFKKIAEQAGYELEFVYFSYFNFYCAFFVPLYIMSLAFGFLRFAAGARDFSSYNLVVLRKPGPPDEVVFGPHARSMTE
jgi:SAM-dependent methyltransferase